MLSTLIFSLDQFSKYAAIHYLSVDKSVSIFPFFQLSLNYNSGAAFSFLAEASGWQVIFFSIVSAVVVTILLLWLLRLSAQATLTALSIALVMGGALGNLVDRLRIGYVTDFLDFYLRSWHFPTFNVADSAICVGVALLLIDSFKKQRHHPARSNIS